MRPAIATFSFAAVAALFTLSAQADTGRPSCDQMLRADPSPAVQVESSGPQPGSYAKYLMLNGVTREAAIKAAWNIDHPAAAPRGAEVATTASASSAATDQR